jgi:hypothetical protein
MRSTTVIVTLFVLALLGYLIWPIYALGKLARAVEARDVQTVLAHVNVPEVRRSLVVQILDTYLKLTGKVQSPLLRSSVIGAGASIADPIVAEMMGTPEALAELLRTGWPSGAVPGQPSGINGLTPGNLGSFLQIYLATHYGIRRFEIAVPPALPYDRRIDLEFRLISWDWRLVRVRLPQHLRVQLAQLLIKAEAKKSMSK